MGAKVGDDYTFLADFLREYPSTFIRCQWVDYSGIVRARNITADYAKHLARSHGAMATGATPGTHLEGIFDNTKLPDYDRTITDSIYPDWKSLRPTAIQSCNSGAYASVMCFCIKSDSENICPREALRQTLDSARRDAGLEFLIGFELEIMITSTRDRNYQAQPLCHGSSSAASCRTAEFEVIEGCVHDLLKMGIGVQTFHAEGDGAQYEIALSPLPPLEGVDALVLATELVRTNANKAGFHATLHPRPFADRSSNALHVHVSIDPLDKEDLFLSGVLNRLPAICAFTMPFDDSYSRLQSGEDGLWVTWGTQNRDAPIRKIHAGRWEFRPLDATANPFLAVAAILRAGLLGIQNNETLRHGNCRAKLRNLNQSQMTALGIDTRLPVSLSEALQQLASEDSGLTDAIGSHLVRRIQYVKKHQLQVIEQYSKEEVKNLMLAVY